MFVLSLILLSLLAVLHFYILVLEMFQWTSPRGRKAFGTTPEFAEATRTLAANQGLYNGFLAAGFVWAVLARNWDAGLFFTVCVLVAGIYGGLTASRRILMVQALPALITLVVLLLARSL